MKSLVNGQLGKAPFEVGKEPGFCKCGEKNNCLFLGAVLAALDLIMKDK